MQKGGRKKQARSNKQQGRANQRTQGSHFSQRKMSCLGWDVKSTKAVELGLLRGHAIDKDITTIVCVYVYVCVYLPTSGEVGVGDRTGDALGDL